MSTAAASVALNGSNSNSLVSDSTRERIMAVAAELRYSPNVMARGLKRVRLNSLGISFPSMPPEALMTNNYSGYLLGGVNLFAHQSGYNVTIFNKPWHDAKQSSAGFRDQGIEGFVIVAPIAGSGMVAGLSDLSIPLVVISSSSEVHNVPSVDVDNVKAVHMAIDHLLALGHRRIAHLYLDGSNASFDSFMRRDTFLNVMRESGNTVPPEYVRPITGAYHPAAYYETQWMLSLPNPPTALFATNDWLARHAMEAAIDIGMRVPEQFSVVGFDDIAAAVMIPAITTIGQPLLEMGQAAARLLITLVEGGVVPPVTHLFEPELIVRGSTSRL